MDLFTFPSVYARVIFDTVIDSNEISQIHTDTAKTVTNEMLLLPPYDKALEMVGLGVIDHLVRTYFRQCFSRTFESISDLAQMYKFINLIT